MAFDVITPVKLGQGSILVTTLVARYTVPAATRTMVKDITIANITASPISVTVYLVPAGNVAGAANTLLPAVIIPGYTTLQWNGVQIMNEGDFIWDTASVAGCTINVSGAECVS